MKTNLAILTYLIYFVNQITREKWTELVKEMKFFYIPRSRNDFRLTTYFIYN